MILCHCRYKPLQLEHDVLYCGNNNRHKCDKKAEKSNSNINFTFSTGLECQPRLCSDCSHGGKGQEEESFLHAHHVFGQEARV